MNLFDQLLEDSNKAFTGWDFSFIEDTGRVQSELLPWSYGSKARKYLFGVKSMLDMGTGGGEFFLSCYRCQITLWRQKATYRMCQLPGRDLLH